MNILLIHGIGGAEQGPDHGSQYYKPWEQAINQCLSEAGAPKSPEYIEFFYDDLVANYPASGAVYAEAIGSLVASAAYHAVADPITD